MAIVHQLDKRSGITYAYESTYYWDEEKKQSRSKRKLIGRVDDKTGEIVPTDGRMRRAKERKERGKTDEEIEKEAREALEAKVGELERRVEILEAALRAMKR